MKIWRLILSLVYCSFFGTLAVTVIAAMVISLALCAEDSRAAHRAWHTASGTITERGAVAGDATKAYRPDTVAFVTATGERRTAQVLLDWHRPVGSTTKVYYRLSDGRFLVAGDKGLKSTNPWPSVMAHAVLGIIYGLVLFLFLVMGEKPARKYLTMSENAEPYQEVHLLRSA